MKNNRIIKYTTALLLLITTINASAQKVMYTMTVQGNQAIIKGQLAETGNVNLSQAVFSNLTVALQWSRYNSNEIVSVKNHLTSSQAYNSFTGEDGIHSHLSLSISDYLSKTMLGNIMPLKGWTTLATIQFDKNITTSMELKLVAQSELNELKPHFAFLQKDFSAIEVVPEVIETSELINTNTADAYSLYPNPTQHVLSMMFNTTVLAIDNYKISSIDGRDLTSLCSIDQQRKEIDVRRLVEGNYYLEVNLQNGLVQKRYNFYKF